MENKEPLSQEDINLHFEQAKLELRITEALTFFGKNVVLGETKMLDGFRMIAEALEEAKHEIQKFYIGSSANDFK